MNGLIELLAALIGKLDALVVALKAPAPAPPPKPAARTRSWLDGPPPPKTELERIQRHFAFLREHGGIVAEARRNQWGEFEWRRYR